MKKQIMILLLSSASVLSTSAQDARNDGFVAGFIFNDPANLVQFQVRQKLFAHRQNGDIGVFSTTDQWSALGRIDGSSQTLYGLRLQRAGRGLTMGFTGASQGTGNPTLGNSFIEWIGNNGESVTPGDLDFNYGANPTNAFRVTALKMQPVINLANPTDPNFNSANVFATNRSILGHLQAGNFGDISGNARWIGIGAARIGGVLNDANYGLRVQRDGNSYIANLTNNGEAIVGWGPGNDMYHRFFNSNNSFLNVVRYRPNGCIEMGDNITAYSFDPKLRINSQPFRTALAIETDAGAGIEMLVRDRTGIDVTVVQGTNNQGEAYGLWSKVSGADDQNFGVNAIANDATVSNYKGNWGVRGVGLSGTVAIGVEGFGSDALFNYSIYANEGTNGIFNTAAYLNGSTWNTAGFWQVSDRRFKKDIETEKNALITINSLNPVSYNFNTVDNKWIVLSNRKQHGFISQEVEKVLPELVQEAKHPVKENGKIVRYESYKGLNYDGFIALLTKAIQEQQVQIEELKSQLTQKSTNQVLVVNETANPADAKEMASKAYMLAQNVPNPFTSSTTINYSIPENKTAMIAVFDLNGKMLLQFPNLKSASQITINGSTLQAGMYLYSLLVNGQEIITKKMILTK